MDEHAESTAALEAKVAKAEQILAQLQEVRSKLLAMPPQPTREYGLRLNEETIASSEEILRMLRERLAKTRGDAA